MTNSTYDDKNAIQALNDNLVLAALAGHRIESGCSVSINSGTLGASDTLTVASGTAYVDGQWVDVPQQSVGIGSANSSPRKDVVYIDATGTAQTESGNAEPKDPSNARWQDAYRPAPPSMAAFAGAPLQEVWVPADSGAVDTDNLEPRRVDTMLSWALDGTPVFDIREFGAEEGTDSTTAIIDALAEADSAGGGSVFVPAGTWLLSDELNPAANVTLCGVGKHASTLRVASSNSTIEQMVQIDNVSDVTVCNLTLDANVQNRSGSGSLSTACVRMLKASHTTLKECIFTNFGSADTGSPAYAGVAHTVVEGDATDCHHNRTIDCEFIDPTRAAQFGWRAATDWTLNKTDDEYDSYLRNNECVGCRFEGIAKSPIEIAGPASVENVVDNVLVESCPIYTSAIDIDFGAHRNRVVNSTVRDITHGNDPEGGNAIRGITVTGQTGQSYPDRIPRGNRVDNCTISNISSTVSGSDVSGFRAREADGLHASITVDGVSAPSNVDERAVVADSGRNVVLSDCHLEDAYRGFRVINGCQARIDGATFENVTEHYPVYQSPAAVNGWGTNSGNPNNTGVWSGSGYERVKVRDTTNNTSYVYLNGTFETI